MDYSADSPQRDAAVLHFRKTIELAQKPEHFMVQVSADNQFIFYVNEQWVGAGPAKSDLGHWRYETYDIAPMLRPGKNVLAAVVWNFACRLPWRRSATASDLYSMVRVMPSAWWTPTIVGK